MARVLVPSAACAGVDVDGRRYRASKDGSVDVPDRLVGRLLKNGECFLPSAKPLGVLGFVCTSCGFHGYFRTCGRCGGESQRPTQEFSDVEDTED